MAAFTRRQYKGAAVSTTTTNSLNTSDTSVTIASNTGWPSSAGVPFYVVIDPGTSAEEKCSATISGTTLTLTRAQDDTTASAHSSGATIYPVFTANDADEANELVAKLTTKGDLLVTDGSALNRLAVGTNDYALLADSTATNGVKWGVPTDSTKIPLSTVTTKGDLIAATASSTVGRLAAGTNEFRLVADSAQTAGLKYVADTTNYAIAAKGDLLVGTAADTVTNLTVGTNGHVLTADSAQASGVKWAATTSPGLVCVKAETAFTTASSVTVDNVFTSSYTNYIVEINYTTSSTGGVNAKLRASGTSASTNYTYQQIQGFSTTASTNAYSAQTSIAVGYYGNGTLEATTIRIMGPQLAQATQFVIAGGGLGGQLVQNIYGHHTTATAYDGLELLAASGTMTGTYAIYAYSKALS